MTVLGSMAITIINLLYGIVLIKEQNSICVIYPIEINGDTKDTYLSTIIPLFNQENSN